MTSGDGLASGPAGERDIGPVGCRIWWWTLHAPPDPAAPAALRQALCAAGAHLRDVQGCAALVHAAPEDAPDQVVAWAPAGALEATLPALMPLLASGAPWPLSLVSPLPPAGALEPLWQAGLAGWWPDHGTDPCALAAGLAGDRRRWHREAALRAELVRARARLDERKHVDRAKGVLMSARGIGEDEAFRLLRGAAMHAKLRVGEVSRAVVEASQWAEAINRAGQLRMLSQRVLKLALQRAAGIDVRRTRELQSEAAQRLNDNLAHLAGCPPVAESAPAVRESLAFTTRGWEALAGMLGARATPALLAQADRLAIDVLQGAETLTDALEQAGGRRALHLVNLCGRQRMRVQRLAKDLLLAVQLAEPARLAAGDSRQLLGAAREDWLRLLRAVDAGAAGDSLAVVCHAADSLLELFERLTTSYEHSLQVIMS